MPVSDRNRAIVIAKGKLADVIKIGLELSDAEYYGVIIASVGGPLWKNELKEIATRPDFPL